MHTVHMKRVTPTQARRDWFRLLDEVVSGEVLVLERNGQRIVVRKEPGRAKAGIPDYSKLIRVLGDDDADLWKWDWTPRNGLRLKSPKKR